MGEGNLKQDRFRKMEKLKETFTLVSRGESNVNIIQGTVYFSQHNCPRTRTFTRGSNTGIKSVSRESIVKITNNNNHRVIL